ncbi:sulfatase-like hydrolase/transferase [Halovivax cerinus]|uniref:Sulfatase-like hydrolase/transferase n=1 Tax=Halovivax cerinus TaxID=1487865 RepID=A0ABD5NNF1_9EURY|nr:sulfatase-like hydrolase/transferase [Halovivax cerinus]
MLTQWPESAASFDATNVFVYVGDAVRWDHTPNRLLDRGVSCETIAASTHSPTSFASLATGWAPPRHGVRDFTDRLPADAPTFFDLPGFDTRFVNSVRDQPSDVDPIYSVLDVEPPPTDHPFDGIDEPFAVMERGPGGHAPYGTFEGTAWEYFEARGSQPASEYEREYATAVADDADRFERRLDELDDRGLREETLVVYTSDHGELLGEGGVLGHNAPMHPALVRVPTVFVHPDLPATRLTSGVFRHVDLRPTIVDALNRVSDTSGRQPTAAGVSEGQPTSDRTAEAAAGDGVSRIGERLPRYGSSFYESSLPVPVTSRVESIRYEGVWDRGGGRVFAASPAHERLAALGGKLLKSPTRDFLRANLGAAIRSYAAGDRRFGSPTVSRSGARNALDALRAEATRGRAVSLTDEQRTRLEELGYLS